MEHTPIFDITRFGLTEFFNSLEVSPDDLSDAVEDAVGVPFDVVAELTNRGL